VSPLRDFLVAPRAGAAAAGDPARRVRGARADASSDVGAAVSLGVLAPARDLPAAAAGVGLAVVRAAPAVLVCVGAPIPAPVLPAPARTGAARLAASLRARDLEASARGRLALVRLPGDRAQLSGAAARALAAAGPLPTVVALAARDDEVDALLAARDAILVALPTAAEPAMAHLALAGAAALVPCATAVALSLDPLQRALALAGVRAPRAIAQAVMGLVA
jgi:hypothetical protein